MAAVQDKVVLKLAYDTIVYAGKLIDALDELNERFNWREDAEIKFNDHTDVIEGNGETQHAKTGDLNKMLETVVPGILSYITVTEVGAKGSSTYKEIIQSIRKE